MKIFKCVCLNRPSRPKKKTRTLEISDKTFILCCVKKKVPEPAKNKTASAFRLPQSARLQPKPISNSNLDLARPESAAAGSGGDSTQRNKNRIKLNKIDLTNQNNEQPGVKSKPNELRKSKNFLSFPRESLVKKKPVVLKKNLVFLPNNRPVSAMSNLTTDSERNTNDLKDDEEANFKDKMRSKSSLFFDYSKLVSIESNLDQQETVVSNDLYPIESARNGNEFLKSNLLGDQEAYKHVFLNENDNQETASACDEVNWLELPDEIWLRIIKLLEHKDLAQFGCVCKQFNSLYLDKSLCNYLILSNLLILVFF